jgi:hypothetical protein
MSLTTLRQVRMERLRPGLVMVLLADLPEWLERADPTTIIVRPGDAPTRMDWRPVVQLPAAVFCRDEALHHFLTVLDALQAVGAKMFGAATSFGVFPLSTDANEEHERLLRRGWEALCRC